MQFIILAAIASVAASMPSYIAVPADQIAFVDLRELRVRRVPRQTLSPPPPPQLPQALYNQDYQPIPIPLQYQQQPRAVALSPPPEPEQGRLARIQSADSNLASSSNYAERPPDFGEYVDFGAHTGDNGAFGWYADYPINNHEEHSSY